MVFYTKGGFTYEDVYFMPVYLRNFQYKQLSDTLKQQADAMKNATKGPPRGRFTSPPKWPQTPRKTDG